MKRNCFEDTKTAYSLWKYVDHVASLKKKKIKKKSECGLMQHDGMKIYRIYRNIHVTRNKVNILIIYR